MPIPFVLLPFLDDKFRLEFLRNVGDFQFNVFGAGPLFEYMGSGPFVFTAIGSRASEDGNDFPFPFFHVADK